MPLEHQGIGRRPSSRELATQLVLCSARDLRLASLCSRDLVPPCSESFTLFCHVGRLGPSSATIPPTMKSPCGGHSGSTLRRGGMQGFAPLHSLSRLIIKKAFLGNSLMIESQDDRGTPPMSETPRANGVIESAEGQPLREVQGPASPRAPQVPTKPLASLCR